MKEMLKLKIKLNFKILFVFLITNVVFSQGIFIHQNHKNILSYSAFYSKHEKLKDYNYGLKISSVWNGKVQLELSYNKLTEYFNVNTTVWHEFSTLSAKYFIKSNQFLNYSLATSTSTAVRNIDSDKTSFSFMMNSQFNGSIASGMIYHPYIKVKRVFDGNFLDILKDIDKTDLYIYNDFYELGFFVDFNDMWLRPYIIKKSKSSSMFSGIEVGFCYF